MLVQCWYRNYVLPFIAILSRYLPPGKDCRGKRKTLLSSNFAPNLSRFSLDLSRFPLILRAFPEFRHFTVSRLFSAYLGMSFPSNGLKSGLKRSMNFNLDHCPKPQCFRGFLAVGVFHAQTIWSKFFRPGKFCSFFGKCRLTSVDRLWLSMPFQKPFFRPFIWSKFQEYKPGYSNQLSLQSLYSQAFPVVV